MFVMIFLTEKNVSNSDSEEGNSHCWLFHCGPAVFLWFQNIFIFNIQILNIIKSPTESF